ncbi:MAG: hypothetical protein MZU84_07445 [Sphingobacterium sp.]|nr:hypothetical protein [Sphingobacterium sp.]
MEQRIFDYLINFENDVAGINTFRASKLTFSTEHAFFHFFQQACRFSALNQKKHFSGAKISELSGSAGSGACAA